MVAQKAIEDKDGSGNLIKLLKTTKSFLEVAFSVTVANTECKNWLDWIGVGLQCY